jgi:protein involved in polysaccharide export with SLBB domain
MRMRRTIGILVFCAWWGLSALSSALAATPASVIDLGGMALPMADPAAAQLGRPEPTSLPAGRVDPEQYLLGPGDQLEILILGDTEERRFEWIGPDGGLTVSPAGALDVVGMTLAAAEREVKQALARYYVSARVQLRLRNMRTFRVRVVGAIDNPGEYLATPLTHASDLLAEAEGRAAIGANGLRAALPPSQQSSVVAEQRLALSTRGSSEAGEGAKRREGGLDARVDDAAATVEVPAPAPRRRRVLLLRAGEDPLAFDLAAARLGWQGAVDPLLRGGDLLSVPTQRQFARIEGDVFAPGEVEVLAGDTAADLIRIAGGVRPTASDYVLVKRATDKAVAGGRVLSNRARARLVRVGAGDVVYVPSDGTRALGTTVTIEGAVLFPGPYPLLPGTDRVRDLLLLAGGFAADAAVEEVYILRRDGETLTPDPGAFSAAHEVANILDAEDVEYMLQRRFLGRRVVRADLRDLSEPHLNPLLRAGDVIRVPRADEMVYVAGAVANPGGFARVEGADFDYYVERAGGKTGQADWRHRRVISAASGQWQHAGSGTSIHAGDTLWIPAHEERDWWEFFREGVAVTAQLATIYLVLDRTR